MWRWTHGSPTFSYPESCVPTVKSGDNLFPASASSILDDWGFTRGRALLNHKLRRSVKFIPNRGKYHGYWLGKRTKALQCCCESKSYFIYCILVCILFLVLFSTIFLCHRGQTNTVRMYTRMDNSTVLFQRQASLPKASESTTQPRTTHDGGGHRAHTKAPIQEWW